MFIFIEIECFKKNKAGEARCSSDSPALLNSIISNCNYGHQWYNEVIDLATYKVTKHVQLMNNHIRRHHNYEVKFQLY